MRTFRTIIIAAVLLAFASSVSFGATANDGHDVTIGIVEVAVMALSSGAAITLNTVAAAAGSDPTGQSDNSKTLEYTSLNAVGLERIIEAQLDVATPAGTSLNLTASDPADSGGMGVSAGPQLLSNLGSVDILTNIGSVATGGGGPTLTYQLNVTSVPALVVVGCGIGVCAVVTGLSV